VPAAQRNGGSRLFGP